MAVGPQLIGIQPNSGDLITDGSVRNVSPQELIFRFDENQIIDQGTLDAIRIVRSGNDGSFDLPVGTSDFGSVYRAPTSTASDLRGGVDIQLTGLDSNQPMRVTVTRNDAMSAGAAPVFTVGAAVSGVIPVSITLAPQTTARQLVTALNDSPNLGTIMQAQLKGGHRDSILMLDPAVNTLPTIDVSSTGDERLIPTFLEVGSAPRQNEVIARFSNKLPDDDYRIEVFGFDDPALGIVGLRNLLPAFGEGSVSQIPFPTRSVSTPGVTIPPANFFGPRTTTINFETLPNGQALPNGVPITNQFAGLGVTFGFSSTAANQSTTIFDDTANGNADPISGTNSLFTTGSGSPPVVRVDFDDAILGELPTSVGLVFSDGPQNVPFTVNAYDSAGRVVETATINTADNSPASTNTAEDTFIGFQHANGISRIEYTVANLTSGGVIGFEIDNLQFGDTPADGVGTGPNPLVSGLLLEPRNEGARKEVVDFTLDLGAQVSAVVPQPVVRLPDGSLNQRRNEIVVYFNDDDLFVENLADGSPSDRSAENPRFYTLIYTEDSASNRDDTEIPPSRVVYNPAADTATLIFDSDLSDLVGGKGGIGTFRLRVGTAEAIPLAPQRVELGSAVAASDLDSEGASILRLSIGCGRASVESPFSSYDREMVRFRYRQTAT
ncbi:MAG: hypothetical protein R3C05_27200 [Pirellulaceae bacterium]